MRVQSTAPDGAARAAGLLSGDIIVAVDGIPVGDVDELHRLMTEERVGKPVPITVLRLSQKLDIVVTARIAAPRKCIKRNIHHEARGTKRPPPRSGPSASAADSVAAVSARSLSASPRERPAKSDPCSRSGSAARASTISRTSTSTLPRDRLVVITGLSGSGKSSLAFDTIYAEGQRRYVESLSAYARQFLELMQKPDVDQIDGLSPAISIEQKTTSRNPRSTVGTVTEIYDYMRLLWARVGIPYSPATGLPIESQTVSQMVDRVLAMPRGHAPLPARADRARPQGRVSQGARRAAEARLPAGQDRRRDSTRSTRRRRSTRSSSTTSRWSSIYELRKGMGTSKPIDSSAAFLFEVPG